MLNNNPPEESRRLGPIQRPKTYADCRTPLKQPVSTSLRYDSGYHSNGSHSLESPGKSATGKLQEPEETIQTPNQCLYQQLGPSLKQTFEFETLHPKEIDPKSSFSDFSMEYETVKYVFEPSPEERCRLESVTGFPVTFQSHFGSTINNGVWQDPQVRGRVTDWNSAISNMKEKPSANSKDVRMTEGNRLFGNFSLQNSHVNSQNSVPLRSYDGNPKNASRSPSGSVFEESPQLNHVPARALWHPLPPIPVQLDQVLAQRAGTRGSFVPSRAVPSSLLLRPYQLDTWQAPVATTVITAVPPNPRYHGNMTVGSNQVPNLPEWLNTAKWIMNIPSNASMKDLLSSVRNCGKIFQCHINPAGGPHFTTAAKLVFCTVEGAMRFQIAADSAEGIVVLGKKVYVCSNRNKYRANSNLQQSRMLHISGPAQYVDYSLLTRYFSALFRYDIISVSQTPVDAAGNRTMEWEFGSILAQANSARLAILNEPALKGLLTVTYARDPCE